MARGKAPRSCGWGGVGGDRPVGWSRGVACFGTFSFLNQLKRGQKQPARQSPEAKTQCFRTLTPFWPICLLQLRGVYIHPSSEIVYFSAFPDFSGFVFSPCTQTISISIPFQNISTLWQIYEERLYLFLFRF